MNAVQKNAGTFEPKAPPVTQFPLMLTPTHTKPALELRLPSQGQMDTDAERPWLADDGGLA